MLLSLLRFVHILAGSLALLSLWIPLFSAKGRRLHRQAGRVFVWSMGVLCAAALLLCAIRFAHPGRRVFSIFLAFVSLLGWHSASSGRRVVTFREERQRHRAAYDYTLSTGFLLASLALGAWGVMRRDWLFVGFAGIGAVTSTTMLHYWLKRAHGKNDYIVQHLSSMLVASITTLTALLVVNARHFLPHAPMLFVWLSPAALGTPVIFLWRRKYQ